MQTADYHTAGEPFRIVVGGVSAPRGATVLDRRSDAIGRLDHIRAFLCNEPRGHGDMYGCFVTPPDDDGAEFGALFFHKDGFSTACGHGTIALATWAIETGVLAAVEPVTTFAIDVPSGRLTVRADVTDGRVGEVRFTNVASWVSATGVEVVGRSADISFGGAFYASVEDGPIAPERLDDLIALARRIKADLADHPSVSHPLDGRLSGLYGVIFHETISSSPLHQRNVTVFADGEVDRSPCGSGTSARLALLHDEGVLAAGDLMCHEGIVGTMFTGRVVSETIVHGRPAVITEVGGRASRTGFHTFVLEPDDELGLGFQLR